MTLFAAFESELVEERARQALVTILDVAAAERGREGEDDGGRAVVITANDGGAAWTPDEGRTWFALPGISGFWAVAFASPKAGWLVGTDGRIVKVSF